MGKLANLRWLNLRYHELSGEIPPELLVLFYLSLEDLRLDGNQLIGCLLECVATDRPGDAEVLASFYNGTDGPNWHDGDNWLSATPITEWHGVYTDANGRLYLDLDYNGLTGEIPPELANLANLAVLNLDGNDLSGETPSRLGDLAKLLVLALEHNELSGEIPPALGDLANLLVLNLRHNNLSGQIPPELSDLTNLRVLYLSDNSLSGCVPNALQEQLIEYELGGLPFCSTP